MVRRIFIMFRVVSFTVSTRRVDDVIHVSVSKTNLAVHEDKNRVPFVKVPALLSDVAQYYCGILQYCAVIQQ